MKNCILLISIALLIDFIYSVITSVQIQKGYNRNHYIILDVSSILSWLILRSLLSQTFMNENTQTGSKSVFLEKIRYINCVYIFPSTSYVWVFFQIEDKTIVI